MDEFREMLRQEVTAANRAPFQGWWAALLDVDPEQLRRIHVYLNHAEQGGPIPEALRHLIWVAVDSVVTHLYPRGAGVHIKLALDLGATVRQVLETLYLTNWMCSHGYGRGLQILNEELGRRDPAESGNVSDDAVERVQRRIAQEFGEFAQWAELEARTTPETLDAFLDLAGERGHHDGLDDHGRHLIMVAIAACPAIADEELTRISIANALGAGIDVAEIRQALRLSNTIPLHALSEGVMLLKALEL